MRQTKLVWSAALAVIFAAGTATEASAQYASHLIFLTSTPYTGDLGGLAGADALCQSHASNGSLTQPLGRTWRALISIYGVVDAKDRFVWAGPVHDVTGLVVTNHPGTWPWSDDGASTVDVDENGDAPPEPYVWTGSVVSGVSKGAGYDCNGWTDDTSSFNGWSGQWGYFGSDDWIDSFSSGCGDPWYSLYCVSGAKIYSDDFAVGTTCSWSARAGSDDKCPI